MRRIYVKYVGKKKRMAASEKQQRIAKEKAERGAKETKSNLEIDGEKSLAMLALPPPLLAVGDKVVRAAACSRPNYNFVEDPLCAVITRKAREGQMCVCVKFSLCDLGISNAQFVRHEASNFVTKRRPKEKSRTLGRKWAFV
ncbi:hypothetical protein PAAG_11424 [Paracoccidioides lutzii Pb01]|uniref:Uncharacterized protein n=1 Tax=Paracoccidioides lutzii (strain ATCC MYA-826 / Pb01) TaxID=502779 RepID=A0A0A2V2Y0_PARBA|nr:hypothetical protein PAAG_11424 [Paracoccidioides lutzii Pb01]KGQ01848.1 hypothetical protein PAAG_11424 [Paracoccidioides lutzii Pb01]